MAPFYTNDRCSQIHDFWFFDGIWKPHRYDAMQIPQVDQMISSQLGSLNTAAPTGPVWREPKLEQMKEMEEGKKEADELAPMYMEGSLNRNLSCLDCNGFGIEWDWMGLNGIEWDWMGLNGPTAADSVLLASSNISTVCS